MTNITEHYSEEKGESDISEVRRIDLFVGRNSISVYNLLERVGKVIDIEISGWFQVFIRDFFKLNHVILLTRVSLLLEFIYFCHDLMLS